MHRSELTVDLGALRRNVATLRRALGRTELWAVVKADGYGHGARDVARAALDAGAAALCVASSPARASSSWAPPRSGRRARRASSSRSPTAGSPRASAAT